MKRIQTRETTPTTNGLEDPGGADSSTGIVAARSPSLLDENDLVIQRPRRRRWRVVVPIVLLLAVAAATAYYFFRPQGNIPTAVVRRGTIISTVETTGKLEAQRSAKLSFKTSGRVDKVIAKQGDKVEPGDVLAELDTTALQRQLNEARVQLDISKLKLQQAKEGAKPADIAGATADLNGAVAALNQVRAGGRAEDIAAAQAQVREAQAKLAAVKAGPTAQDIAAAQAGVDQAKATLDKVKSQPTAQEIAMAQAKVDQAKANRTQVSATASNAKEQARISMDQAANQMRNAQDAYTKVRDKNAE